MSPRPAIANALESQSMPEGALSRSVFKTMSETDAKLERFAWLGDELAVAIWRRDTLVAGPPHAVAVS
jgi:AraC family transcriptional regulator